MEEKHALRISGRFAEVKTACRFIADAAERCGLDKAGVFHVELACDEACTNVIQHAYGAEGVGEIVVSWQVDDDVFIVTVQDNGRAFDPNEVSTTASDIAAAGDRLEELQAGGLGLHFMRSLMDDVRFEFDSEKGNTLIMSKRIVAE